MLYGLINWPTKFNNADKYFLAGARIDRNHRAALPQTRWRAVGMSPLPLSWPRPSRVSGPGRPVVRAGRTMPWAATESLMTRAPSGVSRSTKGRGREMQKAYETYIRCSVYATEFDLESCNHKHAGLLYVSSLDGGTDFKRVASAPLTTRRDFGS